MAKNMTEDQVRMQAHKVLGFDDDFDGARAGTGQITTFNQLGFPNVADKPDGWYLPDNTGDVALVLETKATSIALRAAQVDELLKNVRILMRKYDKVVGVLYNGDEVRAFKCLETKATSIALRAAQVDELLKNVRILMRKYDKVVGVLYNGDEVRAFKCLDEVHVARELQGVRYYLDLYTPGAIDKEHIYELTARINDCLHFEFGVKNLYHRMIFTACALVAERYGGDLAGLAGRDYATFHNAIYNTLSKSLQASRLQNAKINILLEEYSGIKGDLAGLAGRDYATFHNAIYNTLSKSLQASRLQNAKINILLEEYSGIKMNTTDNQAAIDNFIDWVVEISECVNSNEWRGEDVMGIFFNEFNRYAERENQHLARGVFGHQDEHDGQPGGNRQFHRLGRRDFRVRQLQRVARRGRDGHLLQRVQPVQEEVRVGPGVHAGAHHGFHV